MPIEDLIKKEKPRELKIFYPGEEEITNVNNSPVLQMIGPKDRLIMFGQDTGIRIQEYHDYFYVCGIQVEPETARKQGIGTMLYEEALKLAKKEGKKGLISYKRSDDANRRWEHFKEQGRATKVKIHGETYYALLC